MNDETDVNNSQWPVETIHYVLSDVAGNEICQIEIIMQAFPRLGKQNP